MMEKSALAGEGGDGECTAIPLSLYLPSLTKLQFTLQLRGKTHPPISSLPYMYSVEDSSSPTEKKKIALIDERRGQCNACCESQREGRGTICQITGSYYLSLVLLRRGCTP
jgi:hypothetical protein